MSIFAHSFTSIDSKEAGDMIGVARTGSSIRRRTAVGFTLIEVLVTLAVMTLLASVVLPAVSSRPRPASPELATTIREASRLAVRRSQWLTFRAAQNGGWTLVADVSGQPIAGGLLAERPRQIVLVRLSPLGACLSSAAATSTPTPGCVVGSETVGAER